MLAWSTRIDMEDTRLQFHSLAASFFGNKKWRRLLVPDCWELPSRSNLQQCRAVSSSKMRVESSMERRPNRKREKSGVEVSECRPSKTGPLDAYARQSAVVSKKRLLHVQTSCADARLSDPTFVSDRPWPRSRRVAWVVDGGPRRRGRRDYTAFIAGGPRSACDGAGPWCCGSSGGGGLERRILL